MKKQFALLLLILLSNGLFCQENDFKRHTVGSRFSGHLTQTLSYDTLEASSTYGFGFEPYYLFSFNSYFSLGLMAEYRSSFTNHPEVSVEQNKYGVGLVARFNYPSLNFKEDAKLLDLISLYSEVSYSFTNYYSDSLSTFDKPFERPSDNLEAQILRLHILGVGVEVAKNFNLDVSFSTVKYFPGRWRFMPNFGVYYRF